MGNVVGKSHRLPLPESPKSDNSVSSKCVSSKLLPLQGDIRINSKIIVAGYIRHIEMNYDLSNMIANGIIQIIEHYYKIIINHFQLNNKMSISDFKYIKLAGKCVSNIWKVEMKKTYNNYSLNIFKKKDLVNRKQAIHDHINTERRILANIDHPFLVSLRYAFQSKAKLFLVRDYFDGRELFFYLEKEGKFTEERARFYSAEICLVIEYLHNNYITYRDLKPEDIILCNDGHIKITDGLSKNSISSDSNCIIRTFCGSPDYLAPEMLQQNDCNYMVDWWAFGTILYEMICGLPTFYDKNIQTMYQNILYEPIPFYKFMSKESIKLISKLLHKSPKQRIKCKDIKLCAFFECIDWEKLYKKQIEPPFKQKKTNIDVDNDEIVNNNSKLEFPEDFNEYQHEKVLPTETLSNFNDILFID